jgi:hypothetical protein
VIRHSETKFGVECYCGLVLLDDMETHTFRAQLRCVGFQQAERGRRVSPSPKLRVDPEPADPVLDLSAVSPGVVPGLPHPSPSPTVENRDGFGDVGADIPIQVSLATTLSYSNAFYFSVNNTDSLALPFTACIQGGSGTEAGIIVHVWQM